MHVCVILLEVYTLFFPDVCIGWLLLVGVYGIYTGYVPKKYTTFFLPRKNLHLELNVVATN